MKRLVILLVAIAASLVVIGGAAMAEPGTSGTTSKETQDAETLLENSLKEGGPQGTDATEQTLSTASTEAQPDWLYGPASRSYYYDWFTDMILTYTMDWVAYWGTEDASYPRVGDLYYGRVVVGNVTSNIEAYPIIDVILPPNTSFDIASADPSRKIRCYLWDYQNDPNGENFQELTGKSCPTQPSQGFYGWNLNPESPWRVDPGKALLVDFPIRSTATLSGIAGPDCLIGTVQVGAYDDVPEAGDTCPLADNDGAYQGVFVSEAPDTTAPRAKKVVPAEGAKDIAPGTNVSAFFSEAMRKASINPKTFKLFKAGTTTPIAAVVGYDAERKKAILNPDANLKRGAKYKAVVTTGAKDLAGNRLDQNPTLSGNQPKKWFFTVRN